MINATRLVAGLNVGLEPGGRELLVVAVKGTFVLPRAGEDARLADTQCPLVIADTFCGAPGASAPCHEADFAPRKRACDVLLIGTAHAPDGRPVVRMPVALRVGTMTKRFDVVGDRLWRRSPVGVAPSSPRPFVRAPISYDVAFGGIDRAVGDAPDRGAYLENPVGRGWSAGPASAGLAGRPLPNTQEAGDPVLRPDGRYRPMAFGVVGRGWPPRARFAGTYDQRWLDEVFPFLPADFDERHYQAAPEDQQIPIPSTPLDVVLQGLTPDGARRFVLPRFEAPVQVFPRTGGRELHEGALDTLVFEPDDERFTATWRVTRPLQRSLHEIAQVVIGPGRATPGRPLRMSAFDPADDRRTMSTPRA